VAGKTGSKTFFDGHIPEHVNNHSGMDTLNEVVFLSRDLHLPPGRWILVVVWGTAGRWGRPMVALDFIELMTVARRTRRESI
jgi:hypothetical protein